MPMSTGAVALFQAGQMIWENKAIVSLKNTISSYNCSSSPFHFQALTHCFSVCLSLSFLPLTCFHTTPIHRILVSVCSLKQWCQTKGMFSFRFANQRG